MALTFNGVAVSIEATALPVDYTKPTVTPVSDPDWMTVTDKIYTVVKSAVEDADPATMFGNIVTNVSTQVQSDINANFDTGTSNFTAYATMVQCQSDMDRNGLQSTISEFYASVTINVRKD